MIMKNFRQHDTGEEQAASDRHWDALTEAEQALLYVIAGHFVHNPDVGCGLERDGDEQHIRISCGHCGQVAGERCCHIVCDLRGVPYARLLALVQIWITPSMSHVQ
jgi:hypothetical protein